MAQFTVDYSVRLQVLQSSVEQLQGVLDKLTPNSAGFNRVNKALQSMRREMEEFQVQTSKAFNSQQQFDKAEKTLEKIGDGLVRAHNAMDGLKFRDIKLSDDQIRSFERLDQELVKINERVVEVKKNFRDNLLSKGSNAGVIMGIDPNLITKDFDVIINRLDKAVEKINKKVYEAQQRLNTATQERATKGQQINALTTGGISEQALGSDIFNRFFETTKNGVTRFVTRGFAKGEVKRQFLLALREEFQLTQRDIDTLVASIGSNDTFKGFNQAFINMGNGTSRNIFSNLSTRLASEVGYAQRELTEAQARQSALTNVSGQFHAGLERDKDGKAIGEVARALDEQTQKTRENTEAREANQRAAIEGVRTDQSAAAAQIQIRNSLRSLTEQVQATNVEFLRLQRTQQTFNSIKSTITNFMGFTQVLNLTKTAVREAMNHIKQLDATMNGIAIVTDMTTSDLWRQIDTYSQIAQTYGTSIQGAYEVSKIYYQAGYETNEVLTLMNETLKLSKVSGLDYAKATDYMMTATRGFHMEISEAAKVVDVYSALAANTAVSQEELAVAMSKTASSMEGVGATFEEASSMIATMVAVTRESATNIGSALKSIGSR